MIRGLNHVTITVRDLDESLAFYVDRLGFQAEVRWQRGAYLTAGELWLCLALGTPQPSRDYSHLAFSVAASDWPALCLRLADVPQWQDNVSEGDSLYVCDPNGHRLEMHVGTLHSRLAQLRRTPYEDLQWLRRDQH